MSVIDSRRYGRRSTTSFTRREQNGEADNISGCEVLLHDWAVSRLMSELKKGEAHSEFLSECLLPHGFAIVIP